MTLQQTQEELDFCHQMNHGTMSRRHVDGHLPPILSYGKYIVTTSPLIFTSEFLFQKLLFFLSYMLDCRLIF